MPDLKKSSVSGSEGFISTPKKSAKPSASVTGSGFVSLRSLCADGGDSPGNGGIYIPKAEEIFEATAEQGQALIACGLAELLKGE